MSIEAYDRGMIREFTVWKPFLYSFLFDSNQILDRTIIYGLYSGAYINGKDYLTEIESVDLANLLNDYNTKMAELTNEEQIVVNDIVSKRYLANIEKIIHDQKMTTRSYEIKTDDDLMTAKIAALAVDQAVLDVLNEKVIIETQKTQAKITELQSYIDIECFNLSEVDVKIAEKAIQSAELDIRKLTTANEILKIQIDTIEAAVQLTDVDLQIARTNTSIADINKNIAQMGLLVNDLTIAQANTQIAQAELPISEAKVTLAGEKSIEIDHELTFTSVTQVNQADIDYKNRLAALNLRQTMRETALTQDRESKELSMSNRLLEASLSTTETDLESKHQIAMDKLRIQHIESNLINLTTKLQAMIDSATTLAAAKVSTELTHTISKA